MQTKIIEVDESVEIVSLAEAMEHSRITDSYDELVVQMCLDAAHNQVEQWLNRKIMPTIIMAIEEEFRPSITVPYSPIIEIDSEITCEDAEGNEIVLTKGTDWKFNCISESIIFNKNNTSISTYSNFTVKYCCGYNHDDGPTIPAAIKMAIRLTFATFYEQREDIIVGTNVVNIPNSARRITRSFRVRSI